MPTSKEYWLKRTKDIVAKSETNEEDGHEMKIEGMKELERKLKKLSDVARDDAKQEALYTSSVVVQGDATLNAPVDTGNLRSSIDYEVSSDDADIFTPVQYAVKCVPSFIAI